MSVRIWSQSTEALKIRLQRALAAGRSPWVRPWIGPSAWTSGEAVKQGDVRKNSATPTQWYVAVSSGTCGATEPTPVTGATISDGTVLWTHIGGPAWDPADDVAKPALSLTNSTGTPAGLSVFDVWANRSLLTLRGCYGTQYATDRMNLSVFDSKAGSTFTGGCSAAFWSDCPKLGIEVQSGAQGFGLLVDGRPVTAGAIYSGAAGNYWTTADWGSRKPRLWEVHYGKDSSTLMHLAMTSADQIWPAAPQKSLRGVFIGDSYLNGSSYGPFLPWNTLSAHFGRLAGIEDMWRFGTGGTGLLNQGPSTSYTYRQRLPQALALSPDVICVYGSTNDLSYSQSDLTTEALAFLDAIRASTTAPVFWFGPAPISGSYSGIQTVDAAIAAAVAARPNANIFYRSMVTATPPWLTGSHNNASYAWSSNISQYIGGDNTHPVDKGTMYLANRMAAAYADMLPLVA